MKEAPKMRKRKLLLFVAAIAAVSFAVAPARAQTWPDRPLKFVVAAPAGSSIDVLARVIGDRLKDRLGQPIIVDNRPAAGGTAATDLVAKSPPHGHALVMSVNDPLAYGPHLYSKLPYHSQ